jgi:hypothetical protein
MIDPDKDYRWVDQCQAYPALNPRSLEHEDIIALYLVARMSDEPVVARCVDEIDWLKYRYEISTAAHRRSGYRSGAAPRARDIYAKIRRFRL